MEPNQAYKKDQLASSATKTADLRAYHLECLNSVLARALIIFAQPCVTSLVAAKSRGKKKERRKNNMKIRKENIFRSTLVRAIASVAIFSTRKVQYKTTIRRFIC